MISKALFRFTGIEHLMLNLANILQRADIPTSASVLEGSKQTLGQEIRQPRSICDPCVRACACDQGCIDVTSDGAESMQ